MALTAIITKVEAASFDIETMAGLKTTVPKVDGLQVGDSCLVMYDFTELVIRGVIPIPTEGSIHTQLFGKEVVDPIEGDTKFTEMSESDLFEFSRALYTDF